MNPLDLFKHLNQAIDDTAKPKRIQIPVTIEDNEEDWEYVSISNGKRTWIAVF